jgi:hypothetical protein
VVVVCSSVILELSEVLFPKLHISLQQGCVGFCMSVQALQVHLFTQKFRILILTSEFNYCNLSFVKTKMLQGARYGQCRGCGTTVMPLRARDSCIDKAECADV